MRTTTAWMLRTVSLEPQLWQLHVLGEEMPPSRNRQQTLLTRRRTVLASAKDRLVKAYLTGTLDEGTLKAHSADLEVQLREAERGLDRCGDTSEACGDKAMTLFNWTQEAANHWQGSEIPQKRAILEAVSLNRQLSDTSLCVTKRKPFRELAERLPVGITRGDLPGIETICQEFMAAARIQAHEPVFTGSRLRLDVQTGTPDPAFAGSGRRGH